MSAVTFVVLCPIWTFGTATTVAEAGALRDAGVDGIVAQGSEAARIAARFSRPKEPLVGTLALVPQVIDRRGWAEIATGRIGYGRGSRPCSPRCGR